jgi:heat shock protein HtpX
MRPPTISRNIYEQQSHNKRMTVVVMLLFGLFLAFLGFGFDLFISGTLETAVRKPVYQGSSRYYRYYNTGEEENSGFPFPIPIGTTIAVVGGVIMALWSMRGGARAVLASTGAVPASPEKPAEKQLINIVEEMRIASGLPHPGVYIVPDPDPNAFATGTRPDNSYIAVTQGLLNKLNREELQGVVAHEMSHIRNYDVRLMTIVAAFVGSIILISDWARLSLQFGGGRRRSSSSSSSGPIGIILLVIWLIGVMLAPLLAQLMAMSVSRKREYIADASAAELTRNPLGLAEALIKIDNAVEPTVSIKKGAAHLCIADPRERKINEKEGFFAEIFGTHPPIKKRIMLLKAMAYQRQSQTYASS